MALNDVKYFKAEIMRTDLDALLIGLGTSINDYLLRKIPCNASLGDFFQTFNEGQKHLDPINFFVQTRLQKGRAGIGYHFQSVDAVEGQLRVSVFDNGENVPVDLFAGVYSALRQYAHQNGLQILEEGLIKEY